MAEGGSNAVVVNEEHEVMTCGRLPGPGGHSHVMKLNSNTQHMSASVAIEFHDMAMASWIRESAAVLRAVSPTA